MDINLVHHLGASGRTLSVEEKATLQVTFLQRSREVCIHPEALKKSRATLSILDDYSHCHCFTGESWEDHVLG